MSSKPASLGIRLGLALLLTWFLITATWYASAHLRPGRSRFYDERYSFENVYSLVVEHNLQPANGWYGTLSYLPQSLVLGLLDVVHRWTGSEALSIHDGANFTPLAYFVVRFLTVLYAAGSILLIYRLGRRLFSPAAGLLAALLLATLPQFLHHSGFFKPDALLVLTCLVAVSAAELAVVDPSRGAYARSGVAIGLAVATKLNGVATAIPLVLGSTLSWRREKRVGLWLPLAGLLSVVVYLMLNPYLELTATYMRRNLRRYEIQASKYGSGVGGMVGDQLRLLVGPNYFGLVWGTIALLGVGLLVAVALRSTTETRKRLQLAVVLGFLFGYPVLCAAVTPFARFAIVLPITPFIGLGAAYLLVVAVPARLPRARWRGRLIALILVVCFPLLLSKGSRFVYSRMVPPTWELAASYLEARLPRPWHDRLVCTDSVEPRLRIKSGLQQAAIKALDRPSGETLALCDGEVLLAGSTGSGGDRTRFSPALFRVRGPEMTVVSHPWRADGKPLEPTVEVTDERSGLVRWRLPPIAGDRFVSLTFSVPRVKGSPSGARLQVDGRETELIWVVHRRRPRRDLYVTQRLRGVDAPMTVELEVTPVAVVDAIGAGYRLWRPPLE